VGVHLGIMTPVLSWRPTAAEWQQRGTIEDVAHVVGEAERLGFDFCTCSEHIALTETELKRRSTAYWDPLASFSYLAATTSTIRLVTWLVVLGYHHPLELAKRYGQLDLMSDGRLVLGVGVGTLREEFELIDSPFEGRGARADDAIRALRAVWGRPWASYSGDHYDFADWWVFPHAPRTELPILVGGRTRRSLRRAIELGDGWSPFALTLDEIADVLAWGRALPAWEARGAGDFDLLYSSEELDPAGDPEGTGEVLRRAHDVGVTQFGAHLASRSREHYVEQLAALAALEAGLTS